MHTAFEVVAAFIRWREYRRVTRPASAWPEPLGGEFQKSELTREGPPISRYQAIWPAANRRYECRQSNNLVCEAT